MKVLITKWWKESLSTISLFHCKVYQKFLQPARSALPSLAVPNLETIIIYDTWSIFHQQSALELLFISYSAFLKLNTAKALVEGSKPHDLRIHHTQRVHTPPPSDWTSGARGKESTKNEKSNSIQYSCIEATWHWARCLELQQEEVQK